MQNFITMIQNKILRDLLLDSDHSRAVTIGLQKIFNLNSDNYLFSMGMDSNGANCI